MCIAASIFASSKQTNVAAGNATLAFQFIFGAVYSIGITPLQALYPVEVLSFEIRAKGMAFGSLILNIGEPIEMTYQNLFFFEQILICTYSEYL